MLVRDHPPPVSFSQAHRQPKSERLRFAVRPRTLASHARKSEGDIRAGRHVHLLNFKADRTARPGKEDVPCFPVSVEPDSFEWRRDIEHHEIVGMAPKNSSVILMPNSVRPRFDEITHRNFIIR
jgi:hypothetical protein